MRLLCQLFNTLIHTFCSFHLNNLILQFFGSVTMLQQSLLKPQISEQSLNFDPYADTMQSTNHPINELVSDSQSSDEEIYQIISKKIGVKKQQENDEPLKSKAKVYHQNAFTKLDTKINLHKINNQIQSCEQKELFKEKRVKDKADRATVEQVLDERTRRILLKLLNNEIVSQINGCLSTGKQANVYHAINKTTGKQYAIKIYKTSILVFKDRDRYVEGEFRFRRGYCSSNPRKMVTMWAEKQLRNLKRMQGVITSPVGLLVKSNVLVMDFIGKDMKNAPRLKDAEIYDIQSWSNLYLQVAKIMRIMYQKCKLIHADFSQYNMLYYEGKIYVIDVSQSVEHDHPHALDFLRRDITNVNDFFKKKHVNIFSDWNLFQFIVAMGIKEGQQIEVLEEFMSQLEHNSKTENDLVDDDFFKKVTIPRTLGNIPIEKVEKDLFGVAPLPFYEKVVTGIDHSKTIPEEKDELDESSSSSSSDSESEEGGKGETVEGGDGEAAEGEEDKKQKIGGKQKYEGLSKLQRKHKVKEEKREKRKEKIPKKQKKKMLKKR